MRMIPKLCLLSPFASLRDAALTKYPLTLPLLPQEKNDKLSRMTKGLNPQAVALGKLRWKGKTKAERRAHAVMMRAARKPKVKATK